MAIFSRGMRPLWRVTSVVAILSVVLSGCVTSMQAEDSVELSVAEKELRSRTEAQRVAQGAATGAIVGVIAGTVLGAVLGAQGGNAGLGALIGAAGGGVAGGLAGAAYGSYVNARARPYANQEVRANTMMEEADKDIAHYTAVNAAARTILAEQEAKITRLNDAYKGRKITKETFQREMSASNNNEKIIGDQCKAIDDELVAIQSDPQSSALTRQAEGLRMQRDSLKATYDRLLQLYGTVPAEVRMPTT